MSRKLAPIDGVVYVAVTAQVARSIAWRFVRMAKRRAGALETESANATLISVPQTNAAAGEIRALLTAAEDIDDLAHAGVEDVVMVQIRIPETALAVSAALRRIDDYRTKAISGSGEREQLDSAQVALTQVLATIQ